MSNTPQTGLETTPSRGQTRRVLACGLTCGLVGVTLMSAGSAWAQGTPVTRVIGERDVIGGYDLDVISGLRGTTDGALSIQAADNNFQITTPFPANGGMRLGLVAEPNAAPAIRLERFDFIPTNAAQSLTALNIADDRTLSFADTVPADDQLYLAPVGSTGTVFLTENQPLPAELNLPGYTWEGFGVVRLQSANALLLSGTYTDGSTDTYAPQNITGTRVDQGLFRYDNGTWSTVLKTGDTIAGLTGPEATVGYRSLGLSDFSRLGSFGTSTDASQWAGMIDLDPTARRSPENVFPVAEQFLVNGTAVTADGVRLFEKTAAPASIVDGGSNGFWYGFSNAAINNNGTWVVAAELAATLTGNEPNRGPFETVILQGSGSTVDDVLLRTGDLVPSDLGPDVAFDGRSGDLHINNDGDVAILWNENLFVNGQHVAGLGTDVLSPEGDPAGTIGDISSTSLTLSDRNAADQITLHFAGRQPNSLNTQGEVYRLVLDLGIALDLAGDFNGNGTVEQADLDLVLGNWGAATTPAGFIANTQGLTDGVDQDELDAVLGNWGASGSPSFALTTVPEPGIAAFFALSAATLLTRRRHTA